MTWYAAHLIQYVRFLDGIQDRYPCYENVVLIEASSVAAAVASAEDIGRTAYGADSGTGFTWDERRAEWVFAGLRKLIECEDAGVSDPDAPDRYDAAFRPGQGTEVTYSQIEVRTRQDLIDLVAGKSVFVLYDE